MMRTPLILAALAPAQYLGSLVAAQKRTCTLHGRRGDTLNSAAEREAVLLKDVVHWVF